MAADAANPASETLPPLRTEGPGRSRRVLVVGAGGIGGTVAATLLEAGKDVTAFTTNAAIAQAVSSRGFVLRDAAGKRAVAGPIVTEMPAGPFDFVLLSTQPPEVEQAARMALPALADDGRMVCFQNGLCEARVAAIAGDARTLGGIVAWGASMTEPGIYERTSAGGFCLGRLDGARDPRLEELARVLAPVGPCEVTQNLAGKRWSKLAINCTITSLGALGGDRLGPLLQHRFVRRLGLEVMTEVVQVARARGVRLEKVAGTLDLDWVALTAAERRAAGSPSLVAKHALLLAVGYRFRRMRSSMLGAIERGRTPAVDFLNGEVTRRGQAHGIATPLNARIRELVWRIARREERPGLALLRRLYDETRGHAPASPLAGRRPAAPASSPEVGGAPPP